jgi:hypothetical protein
MGKLIGLVKTQRILPGTDQRGIILVVVLMVMIVLSLLGSALLTMSFTEDQISRNDQDVVQALYVAEGGVQSTLNQLNLDPAAASPQTGTIGTGQFSATWAAAAPPANQRRIDAFGYVPLQASPRAVKRISVLINKSGPSLFGRGAFGDTFVEISGGSQTDSYDSALGVYGGANVGSNGDVGGNGTIDISNAATVIKGDVAAKVDAIIGGGATVTGTVTDGGAPAVSNPDIDCPSGGFTPTPAIPGGKGITYDSSTGNLEVSKTNLTLAGPGPYYFNDLVIKGAGSSLTFTVPPHIDIYVKNLFDSSGGSVVNTTDPTNLTIYGCGNTSAVAWYVSGGGDARFAMYAPHHPVWITGTSDLWGAVVGKEFRATGGSKLHYDEALGRVSAPGSKYSILAGSWTELSP